MYVYFMKAFGKPPRMKIGKARDPVGRLKELQTGCPYRLELAAKIKCKDEPNAYYVERLAHAYFARYRTQGEWFKCSDFVLTKAWELEFCGDAAQLMKESAV